MVSVAAKPLIAMVSKPVVPTSPATRHFAPGSNCSVAKLVMVEPIPVSVPVLLPEASSRIPLPPYTPPTNTALGSAMSRSEPVLP
jgi:hypothetical protein